MGRSRRKPNEDDIDRLKAGLRARHKAEEIYRKRHPQEWEDIYEECRKEEGLTARPGPSRRKQEERLRRHEEQVAKIRRELGLED